MARVVSIGEVMVQLNPVSSGPLRHARQFERHIAGSEANTLVGLEQLGISTTFISRVGDDELGLAIIAELQSSGVDTSHIKRDPSAPTAVYFVQRGYPVPNKTTVFYYRNGSAASKLSPADIDDDVVQNSNLVHITGITPALSESCYAASLKLVKVAQKFAVPLVFDTNIRVKLWKEKEKALQGLRPFFAASRYLLTGQGDLDFLFGSENLDKQVAKVRELAPRAEMIVVKQGKAGASVYTADGKVLTHAGYSVEVIDELGAGDAFDAAFLAALLRGDAIDVALRYANAAGALTVMAKGDLEPLPTWNDLELFLAYWEQSESTLLR